MAIDMTSIYTEMRRNQSSEVNICQHLEVLVCHNQFFLAYIFGFDEWK